MTGVAEPDQDGRNPRVTVLITVHNGARHLRPAIESVLGQSYGDFELLIVDDGSTDDTRQIIRSYRDARIRLTECGANIGIPRAANKGLREARGELVARQDADDISHRSRLGCQVEFMDRNREIAMVGAQVRFIDDAGAPMRAGGWHKAQSQSGIRWQLMFDSPFNHSTIMFRRAIVWQEMGGYNERFPTSLDFELCSRVARACPVRNLPQALVDYRVHAQSVSANYRVENIRRVGEILSANLEFALAGEAVAAEWPRVWLAINNPRALGRIGSGGAVLDMVEWIRLRYRELHPEVEANEEIRLHLATVYLRIAEALAPYLRAVSAGAYARALRYGPGIAGPAAAKWLSLLLLGDRARQVFKRIAGARAGHGR